MQRTPDLARSHKFVRNVPFILAFLAAFPFTLLFMLLVAAYWGYFDMGIGSAANGFVLLFAYGPTTVLFLLVLAAAVFFLLRRRLSAWHTLLAVIAAMALSVSGLFAAEAHRTKDYPGLRQEKNMGQFFRSFVQRWFSSEPKRPNQAMQPTAGRRVPTFSMTPTSSSATTRAFASGS